MRRSGFVPSFNLYKSIMGLCSAVKDEASVDSLFGLLKADFADPKSTDDVYVLAIQSYGKLKSFGKCEDLIEDLRERDVKLTNAIYSFASHAPQ